MADNEIQIGEDLQIVSYGNVPGTDQTQFMINASFGRGLFEAVTLTVLVPSGSDENADRRAALERAKELSGAFCEQARVGKSVELPAVDVQIILVKPEAEPAAGDTQIEAATASQDASPLQCRGGGGRA